jgi:hypothetical protein
MRRRLGIDAFNPLNGTIATDGSGIVAPSLAQAACLTSRGGSCPTVALPGESGLGDVHDTGVVTSNEINSFPYSGSARCDHAKEYRGASGSRGEYVLSCFDRSKCNPWTARRT